MTDETTESGLHIDGDWKAEAAKEKERLIEQEKAEKAKPQDPGTQQTAAFMELINLLAMHAQIALGGAQGPGGEAIPANPPAAKLHIDLLEVLQQKTEGNLTDDEKRVLGAVLHELRQLFVQAATAAPPPPDQGTGAQTPPA